MHKTLRRLPSLDFLRGFEAAGRRLSFTLAAEELFLTQSALSRQVKALEDALGVALFVRRHRALSLTPEGIAFHRTVTEKLSEIARAADALRAPDREPGLTVSTTVSFASLWLIPRMPSFRALHPATDVYVSADDRVVDLARGDVDVAVRYLSDAGAPRTAVKLFGERLLPVASPKLVKRGPPLRQPGDLAGHVLLHLDDAGGAMPWLNWPAWLNSNGASGLKPAGAIRFSLYDQLIQATLDGQGVALGRIPLIAGLLERGKLVAPFSKRYDSPRGYFAIVAPHAVARPEAAAFVAWLRDEAQARAAGTPAPRARATRRPEHAR
jgi:LysR family glycine cleavage system transcriptional activator